MSLTAYLLLTVFLVGAEFAYIQIARRAGWFDRPNERSSHKSARIVQSGGFIVYLSVAVTYSLAELNIPLFGVGLTILALISFRDDFSPVSKRYRLAAHLLAVGLLLAEERLFSNQWYMVAGLLLLGIGLINAYNFMDGINGMTALYSVVTVGTLYFCETQMPGRGASMMPGVLVALVVFSYVNVRRQALCFAGDVGSISLGVIVLYGLLETILRNHTCLPVLFLSVYGVDTFGTIIYRLYRRQPVFRAHRMHLFQQLVHVAGWPHLPVAALYAVVQAAINLLVIIAMDWLPFNQLALALSLLSVLIGVYGWARHQTDSAALDTGLRKRSSSPSAVSARPIR